LWEIPVGSDLFAASGRPRNQYCAYPGWPGFCAVGFNPVHDDRGGSYVRIIYVSANKKLIFIFIFYACQRVTEAGMDNECATNKVSAGPKPVSFTASKNKAVGLLAFFDRKYVNNKFIFKNVRVG
jgi:hypothetical protein